MASQSLYRKYRPQTFADVVGQEHIEQTLRNALAANRVSHAYLFSGQHASAQADLLAAAKAYLTVNFRIVSADYATVAYDMNTNGKDNHALLDVQAAYDFMTRQNGYFWTPTTELIYKADVVAANGDLEYKANETPTSQDGQITWHDVYVFLDHAE